MSNKSSNTPKKVPQTKEQLMADMKRKKELDRKRKIIVGNFYPALIEATTSVDEAKALISAMSSLLMEQVLKTMKERDFIEISDALFKQLCLDGEREQEIAKLLAVFKDENLFVSRELIEGMTRAIDTMISEDMRARKLDTLKPDWEKYLNH